MAKTALVVDDDPIVLEVLRERLESAGYEVIVRDEALGTSALVLEKRPELVVLDVNMPALGGDELASLIRRRADSKVVLYSAKPQHELDALVARTGAAGAIQKSADDSRFLAELRRIVGV